MILLRIVLWTLVSIVLVNSAAFRIENETIKKRSVETLTDIKDPENVLKKIWQKNTLTYTLAGDFAYRNQTKNEIIKSIIELSFKLWEKHSPYKFEYTSKKNASDIKIIFTRDEHESCDKRLENSAAHAFFANHPRYPGEIHVNNEYIWLESTKPSGSISLQSVLLHEIGHVLGLTHSTDTNSIMYPFIFTNSIKRINLQDEINIHLMYRSICE